MLGRSNGESPDYLMALCPLFCFIIPYIFDFLYCIFLARRSNRPCLCSLSLFAFFSSC